MDDEPCPSQISDGTILNKEMVHHKLVVFLSIVHYSILFLCKQPLREAKR